MAYIVIAPTRTNQKIEDCAIFVTDNIDEAKEVARQHRDRHQKKGYESWAKRVKIVSPKTAQAHIEMADKVAYYGKELDWASNGNSFVAQNLIDWANTLRVRADEIVNPESYAA